MCITKEELGATKASWRNFQKRELKRCAQQSEEGIRRLKEEADAKESQRQLR